MDGRLRTLNFRFNRFSRISRKERIFRKVRTIRCPMVMRKEPLKSPYNKVNDFTRKTIIALLAVFLVSSHSTFGQSTWESDATTTINVSATNDNAETEDGDLDNIASGSNITFGNAGHTLTIINEATPPLPHIRVFGDIRTVAGGGGRLIFNLTEPKYTDNLIVGQIGTATRRIATVRIQNGTGLASVGNIYAGTLTIDSSQILTSTGTIIDVNTLTINNGAELSTTTAASTIKAGRLDNNGTLAASTSAIDVGTLNNNGTATIESGTVSILGGSSTTGSIVSTNALTINNTTSGGYNGTITAGDLTLHQGLFKGDITTTAPTGIFTAQLNGDLTIEGTLTVAGNAIFSGNGRADLGIVKITGDFTVDSGTTVALDIKNGTEASTFGTTNTVNGTLEVYGEAPLSGTIIFDISGGGKVIDTSIFTNMVTSTTASTATIGTTPAAARLQANMSDGFLAAMTIHHRYTAWNLVHDRLITDSDNDDGNKSVWFNGTGRSNQYRSSFNNHKWKTVTGGGAIGVDLFRSPRFQTGLLLGYEKGKSETDNDQLESDDFYLGCYGAYIFRSGVDARIVFAQGWQWYDLDRQGNSNVLYTTSFNGWTSEANFEIGKRLAFGNWSLRPVLAADVYNNNLKGTRESGTGAEKITYSKTDFTQMFFRTGTDFRHRTKYYTFNSGIYYAHDMNGAELKTQVTDGTNSAPLVGTELGQSLLLFNFGLDFEVLDSFWAPPGVTTFKISIGYLGEGALDTSVFQNIGYIGFVGKW